MYEEFVNVIKILKELMPENVASEIKPWGKRLPSFLGQVATKLLSNILIGKGIIRVGEGIIRAGGYFNVTSPFKNCW